MGKFKNISTSIVFGEEPGAEFEADIPEPQRSQLIEGGAIEDLEDNTVVLDETDLDKARAARLQEPVEVPSPEESADAADSEEETSPESGDEAGEAGTGGSNPINRRRR